MKLINKLLLALAFIFIVARVFWGREGFASIIFIVMELVFIVFMTLNLKTEKNSTRVITIIAMIATIVDIVFQVNDRLS